ncbi:DUF3006 domain-containing protein [Lutibacter sp. B2]|nr:DUF3006 domain-containing protein [Lutibacter sp. B2]
MKMIIDRFERDYAICEKENRKMSRIQKSKIPIEAKEGDVLLIKGEDIIIDIEETMKRKKEIEEIANDLWD